MLAVAAMAAALHDRRRRGRVAHEATGGEASFRDVAQRLPQIFFVADDDGVLSYANPAWSAHTGQDAQAAPDLAGALHAEDRALLRQAWRQSRDDPAPLRLALRLRDAQGRHSRVQLQATPVRGHDGARRWYGIVSDIEDQARAGEHLAEADRRNDIFLATLAHELRNPLAPIRNAAQVLITSEPDAARQQWALQVIDRQVSNLGLLLDDLLEASRITLGTMSLNKDNIVMRGVVDAAVELARPALDRQRHSFSVSGDALDQPLVADPLRLTQILGILLDNAARYTLPGGRIGLDVNRQDGQVELRVRDSGIGLAASDLERVFEMFTQVRTDAPAADDARKPPDGGLGIGLALVKGLVGLHGGSVSVSSPGLGQGCEFRVVIPLDTAPPALGSTPALQTTSARKLAPPGALRVLVVDDNHDGADSLAALLTHAGHQVEVAYDGQAALRLAQMIHPDVALIDLGMPHLDGCEVARRLRSEPWGQRMYLIAATGWGQAEDRQRTHASGFDRHLVKPIDPLRIVQMLADRGHRPAQDTQAR